VKFTAKHIPFFYLFALFTGTLCFIPAIFVNRFTTAPALWMQVGISFGIIGYVFGYLSKGIVILFSLGLLSATSYQAFYEREWHKTAHRSLRGETRQMLPRYKSLYTHLSYKDLFLYNYAAELNVAGHYKESLQIASECEKLWADYDLQMLMADNCMKMKNYTETERHLNRASAMCPVKFMPLYRLTELYFGNRAKRRSTGISQKNIRQESKNPLSGHKQL